MRPKALSIALVLVAAVPFLGLVFEPIAALLALQCRADPSRAWAVEGSTLPVCTRCLGLYVGAGLGALLPIRGFGRRQLRPWLVAAPLLMLADVLTEQLGLRPAWPALRFVTGIGLTAPLTLALVGQTRLNRTR